MANQTNRYYTGIVVPHSWIEHKFRIASANIIRWVCYSLLALLVVGIADYSPAHADEAFVTIWKTDNEGISEDNQITIPGEGSRYRVDWVAIDNPDINGSLFASDEQTIEFPNTGTYRVSITFDFHRINFSNEGDKEKILEIEQWGGTQWSTMEGAFYGASNLTITAEDHPDLSNVTDMSHMFRDAGEMNADIGEWQTENVTHMYALFSGATSFNQDISGWNTENVTNMRAMFRRAESFNQDIGGWDTGNVSGGVSSMREMFLGAESFNQDLSDWETGNVGDMTRMFQHAESFNQNLGDWDVTGASTMFSMLDNTNLSTENYDQTLIGWSDQQLQSGVSLGASGLHYLESEDERQKLIDEFDWTIDDEGKLSVPEISINPEELDFGQATIGSSHTLTIEIENTGDQTLGGQVSLTENTEETFEITEGDGTFRLTPSGVWEVSVQFIPNQTGEFTGKIDVAHNAHNREEPVEIDLTGEGIASPQPEIVVSEPELDFGEVIRGESENITFEIGNTGEANLSGYVSIEDDANGRYQLSEGAFEFSIQPSGETIVSVTFTPDETAVFTGVIEIHHTAENESNPFIVELTGEGIETPVNAEILNVTVDPPNASIVIDKHIQLSEEVEVKDPETATKEDFEVSWSSSNEHVASVDENGLVTGIATGEATITATSVVSPGVSGTAEIEVHDYGRAEPLFVGVSDEQSDPRGTVARKRTATINFGFVKRLAYGEVEATVLNLFEDVNTLATRRRIDRWSASEYSWIGELPEVPNGPLSMEIDIHAKKIYSSFQVGYKSYRIVHLENDRYEILELDLSGVQDHPPDWQDPIHNTPPGTFEFSDRDTSYFGTANTMRPPEYYLRGKGDQQTMTTDEDILDVLMLYVEDAADSAGNATNMVLNIRNAFNNTNTSFAESGVNARVRSVGIHEVIWESSSSDVDDYNAVDMGDYINALEDAINDSDHFIYELREEYGADIVGMVYTNADGCGRVYEVMSDVTEDFRDKAVFVVKEGGCLGGNFTFAHEIGHLLGARHDWYVDDTDGSPFAYNHGFVNHDGGTSGWIGWRTIMAYNNECIDQNENLDNWPRCQRLNIWSSPDNTHDGDPTGVASGSEQSDNVRTLNNTIPTAVNFEDPAPVVFGTVTDLMDGNGMEEVEMAGIYGPVTDENGFYDAVVRKGKSVWLTPEIIDEELDNKEDYEFLPSSPKIVDNVTSNEQHDFDAGIYYNISGRVQALDNIDPSAVELTGAPGNTTLVTDQYGRYDFDVLANWEGTIIPQKGDGHVFDPPERQYSNLESDLDGEDYEVSLKLLSISGMVEREGTSTGVSGVQMEGLPNPLPPFTTTFNGSYTSYVKYGWSGTVRPIGVGFNFEPATRTYDEITEDKEDDFTAIPNATADSEWPQFGANAANFGRIDTEPIGEEEQWTETLSDIGTTPVTGDAGTVYVASGEGSVYAFDDDGSIRWTGNVGKGYQITAPLTAGSGRMVYIPVVSDNSGRLYQFEEGGSLNAFFQAEGAIHTTPAATKNNYIYIGSDDGHLYSLRGNVGGIQEQWSFDAQDKIRSSPAVDTEGVVYFGSDDGTMYALNPDGTEKWSFETEERIRSAPTLDPAQGDNGRVYFGSDDSTFYAVDMATGEPEWEFATGDAIHSSAAIDSYGNLFFGSNDHHIYAVSSSGSQLGSFNAGSPVTASPAISRNEDGLEVMYVGADEGRMYAFEISSSQFNPLLFTLWDIEPPGSSAKITSAALSEGELYFTHGNELIALGGDVDKEDDGEDDSSETQFTFAAFDPDLILLEDAHIIIWLAEQGGVPGAGPINPEDPCPPGPVYIPQCPTSPTGFGETSPFVNVVAGEEVVIGLASGDHVEDIATGETTEGLIGTVQTTFGPDQQTTTVLGGVTDPEAFADNPDGRPTGLNAFTKTHERDQSSDNVSIYAGHFSTDAPDVEVNLSGEQSYSLGNLGYGEFSDQQQVPPGEYEVSMTFNGISGNKTVSEEHSFTIDLTDQNGEQVGLFAKGFLDPSANNDGPSFNITGISTSEEERDFVTVKDNIELPSELTLDQNYPNPFNPSTQIRFELPEDSDTTLRIYNSLGREITTLVDEQLSAGSHEVTFNAGSLSSGVYFYRLEAGEQIKTRTMTFVK